MSMDAALVFLSVLSFAALVVLWVAAPLQSDEPQTSPVAEPVRNTVAA